jgi:predicted TIM-barrel fold metal-dependent hydrolase
MSDRLIFVSCDSHAGVPKELWSEYLEPRFHEHLTKLKVDTEIYPAAIFMLGAKSRSTSLPEVQHAHSEGWHGLHDAGLRLADMDREGVAAEFIYHGDFRLGDLFHNNTNDRYPIDAWEAGARAWNHWNSDNFDFAKDRFLICGAIGPCVDMDRTVADLEWNADHRFAATYAPGYMTHPDMPPLYDAYWEPFWRTCEERNLALVLHAGYGWEHGHAIPALKQIYDDVSTAAGSTDRAKMLEHADAVQPSSAAFFTEFSSSVRPRRALAQLLMSGVFDRYPNLKLMLTEVRADWIPETLAHFDAVYEARRDDVPAQKKPSEYWSTNCMAGASFIHKAEVEMRHEIGVETITFGRDYPHPEGTWPHTRQWLQDAFRGVPEDELRLMLGENAIRFFGLDRARLREYAERIGLRVSDVLGDHTVAPEVLESFALRGGYLKPAERDARIGEVDDLLQEDMKLVVGA